MKLNKEKAFQYKERLEYISEYEIEVPEELQEHLFEMTIIQLFEGEQVPEPLIAYACVTDVASMYIPTPKGAFLIAKDKEQTPYFAMLNTNTTKKGFEAKILHKDEISETMYDLTFKSYPKKSDLL